MNNDKESKKEYKEKSLVEFINGIADKMMEFTDEKLDKLEEKFSERQ